MLVTPQRPRWKTDPIRAVFFDVDDTLLDFDRCAAQAARRAFSYFGLPFEEHTMDVFFSVNNVLWQQIERGELSFARHRRIRWNQILARLGIVFDGEVLEEEFRRELTESFCPVDGAKEVLAALQPRCLLFAASNAADAAAQRYRLTRAGLMPFFSRCFLSGELGCSKPSREFFAACFAPLPELLPCETLLVGDSPAADMAGGKAFGMHTCLFDPKGCHPHCPDAEQTVGSLKEIPALLFGGSC